VRSPTLGAARDGDGWALLMRDISPQLLPADGIIEADTLDRVLRRLAEMHAVFWEQSVDDAACDFCPTDVRLTLIRPAVARLLRDRGIDFGLGRGWARFDALAPPELVALVRRLHDDPAPLARIIDALPATLLHGDAKLANMGVEGDALWLFDWAMVGHSAVCVELSWFLAVNSSRLPLSLDDVIERYRTLLGTALGRERFARAEWPAQRAALMLIGVMEYGWGKALDADAGRPQELAWWCEGATQAMRFFGW
jgi:hypothetical protein